MPTSRSSPAIGTSSRASARESPSSISAIHVSAYEIPTEAGPFGGPFDLVLANLVASMIVELAVELTAELRPGGRMVSGGIFADREAEVRRALNAAGLHVIGRAEEEEWVAIEAERR